MSPDIITYSTLVKGYCMDGDIDKGFAVLNDMTSKKKHEPDEILYNSLLDGCAKSGDTKEISGNEISLLYVYFSKNMEFL